MKPNLSCHLCNFNYLEQYENLIKGYTDQDRDQRGAIVNTVMNLGFVPSHNNLGFD
jgi:hypothetical protein